jgi:hypothetical protein
MKLKTYLQHKLSNLAPTPPYVNLLLFFPIPKDDFFHPINHFQQIRQFVSILVDVIKFFFSLLVFISHNVCDLERRLITELIDSELCLIAVRANVHIHCKPCHLVHYIGSVPKTPILMNRMVKRIKNKILIESLH